MKRDANFKRRLVVEILEKRELLCSGSATASAIGATSQLAHFVRSSAPAISAAHSSSGSSESTSNEANETHLFATLTNSSGAVVGTASYETETDGTATTQVLVIKVAGAAANASYDVTAGTTDLGALTTDANGNGQLVLKSTSPTSTGTTSSSASARRLNSTSSGSTGTLPAGFTLAAGAAIALASTDTSVDPLNGTFAIATGDIGGDDHEGGCHHGDHGNVARLVAQLTSDNTSTGKAVFTTITHSDGTSVEILRVRVSGADLNSTLDVSVDGTSVGSILTDGNGNGTLILSSNPKNSNVGQLPSGLNVTSTSTITVGTSLSGTFSSSNGNDSSASFFNGNHFSNSLHRRR